MTRRPRVFRTARDIADARHEHRLRQAADGQAAVEAADDAARAAE
jgi:hypothetical protein